LRPEPAPANPKSYRSVSATHQNDGCPSNSESTIIVEEPLEIRVNGKPYAVVMRTPGNEIELAAGFCLTEGIVDSFDEIGAIGFCTDAGTDSENVIAVTTQTSAPGSERNDRHPSRSRLSTTSCGLCGVQMISDLAVRLSILPSGSAVPLETIVWLQYLMSDRQKLSQLTRSAHATALSGADGTLYVVREDVGRHNALDKTIGYALMHKIDLTTCVALLSGRISFDMVQKAIRASIPVVAGISAATSLAVDLARQFNCTLIGLLRDKSMTIYSSPERITDTAQ
jgi:FdhD protein